MRERLNSHHSRWKESILLRNIIDICHRPSIENPVADGLSCMWSQRKRLSTDGSDWSVLADWEASTGITRDIFAVAQSPMSHPLQVCFADDIFFAPIVQYLLGNTVGSSIQERKRLSHRANGFMIEDGKLWRVADKAARRVTQTECIPTGLGFQMALEVHTLNGHFSIESTKLKLPDRFFWPGMDTDCRQVMLECPRCESFGAPTLNSLLQPIRRLGYSNLSPVTIFPYHSAKEASRMQAFISTCSRTLFGEPN
ncbi:hypothetical protein DFH08DRAFT_708715 [Mycena albidolilacea]|uniref:Integrase zinc-binding domain-containing protein n=1 Tax=Mycena albidolilacea TaxID=1033008 RepID=A0AAD6ZNF9_9AGAR|nr:hypothetical protein DFH08DRAFT_708715 [Mycena albidolilacea]